MLRVSILLPTYAPPLRFCAWAERVSTRAPRGHVASAAATGGQGEAGGAHAGAGWGEGLRDSKPCTLKRFVQYWGRA